jgi:hypothetical protein
MYICTYIYMYICTIHIYIYIDRINIYIEICIYINVYIYHIALLYYIILYPFIATDFSVLASNPNFVAVPSYIPWNPHVSWWLRGTATRQASVSTPRKAWRNGSNVSASKRAAMSSKQICRGGRLRTSFAWGHGGWTPMGPTKHHLWHCITKRWIIWMITHNHSPYFFFYGPFTYGLLNITMMDNSPYGWLIVT